MAYSNINKPSDYFNTITWTGDDTSPRSITGVGFQPDLVWGKNRSQANGHNLYDVIRGVGTSADLASNSTNAEGGNPTASFGYLSSLDSDGFTATTGSIDASYFNQNNENYVAWNWLAGTTASGSTSGSGTAKTYNSSTSTTAGFSIVKYVGNGTANHQFPHGLGVKPDMVFIKNLDDGTTNWQGYNKDLTATKSFKLNSTDAPATTASVTNNVEPTTTVFNLGSGADANANDQEHIAYCFASIKGYSKIGQYTGNGSADGTFVYTGFKPAFVLLKSSSSAYNWHMYDDKRQSYNDGTNANSLRANTSDAEDDTTHIIDILSNGFKLRNSNPNGNASGGTYIYMAFAEHPFVSSAGTPVTAR
jgi:hypothetical protein